MIKYERRQSFIILYDISHTPFEIRDGVGNGHNAQMFVILPKEAMVISRGDLCIHRHGNKSLTIPAIAYFINSLHGQSTVRDRSESTYLYIGDVSYKTINYN